MAVAVILETTRVPSFLIDTCDERATAMSEELKNCAQF